MIIVGCSGLGREVAWLCKRNDIQVKGFLDDDSSLHGQTFEDLPVLGGLDVANNYLNSGFIVAIAHPSVRKSIVSGLRDVGISSFPTLIDKGAIVGDYSSIGEGCVVFPGAVITVNCSLGNFTIVNKNCSVGHDGTFSDYCTLAPLAMTGGHVTLGQGVDVGASACIRQGIQVGNSARIGMGSVVVKNVPKGVTMIGNPAKPLSRN